jgi:putative endonuclease
MSQHLETGKMGERAAADLLRSKGFEILATNYRFKKTEIDIIARKAKLLVFVEVKTRSTVKFGMPEEFVDKKKQSCMAQAAAYYLEQNQIEGEIRFDIIAIHKTLRGMQLHHIEDAFFPING